MNNTDVDFLVDLATRFYLHGQTQSRIARDLGLIPRLSPDTSKKRGTKGSYVLRSADHGVCIWISDANWPTVSDSNEWWWWRWMRVEVPR